MPVLNLQASTASLFPLPPSQALARLGPCVQVMVGVAQSIAQQLLQRGQPLPQPASGIALIDTGASRTCVDDAIAQALGLPVINVVEVMSATHVSSLQNIYPVQLEVVGLPFVINAPTAIGAPLAAQGIVALIGRDVLMNCTLFYNGPAGTISLAL